MASKPHGNRKFYDFSRDFESSQEDGKFTKSINKPDPYQLIRNIDASIVGKNTTFVGPFGSRKVVYCDYIASGRSLKFIEDFIVEEVLPTYGNTHTTTSVTSLQTTLYRHEARDIIRNATHASEHDAVIFTGSGTTGAVHKLIQAMKLNTTSVDNDKRPVVFVGPHEHHSNLLPWREIGAKVIRIRETAEGAVDLDQLEAQLVGNRSEGSIMIGCFAVASNVTGILTDDVATTALLHQYGALAFWDYATAAPYVKLDMNPKVAGMQEGLTDKDAMFFSCHKFIGGIQTPGILVAKKFLFQNMVPHGCGGGSVFFVSRDGHRYLKDVELREEGGTPAIVESVRAGLVFQLKENVTSDVIMGREDTLCKKALNVIASTSEIVLLGHGSGPRLPIFSFLIRHESTALFLHYNYVCALLNDLYGIQARGGCACAGPYAQDLLGIDEKLAQQYEDILLEDSRLDRTHLRRREEHSPYEILRPGFTRICLPYFMSNEEADFVMTAIATVAKEGWKLLPQYIFYPETGEWRHHTNTVFKDRRWLGNVTYTSNGMGFSHPKGVIKASPAPKDFEDCLMAADELFKSAVKTAQKRPLPNQSLLFDGEADDLRWFLLPSDAQTILLNTETIEVSRTVPFSPPRYSGAKSPSSLAHHHILRLNSTPDVFTGPFYMSGENKVSVNRTRSRHDSSVSTGSEENFFIPGMFQQPKCFNINEDSPPNGHISPIRPSSLSVSIKNNEVFINSLELFDSISPSNIPSPYPHDPVIDEYVKEMTNEIATELKSEIREVISQVQDILTDSSQDNEVTDVPARSSTSDTEGSLKPEQLAEILLEVSKDLASEVKQELQDVISAVDIMMLESPTDTSPQYSPRNSLPRHKQQPSELFKRHVNADDWPRTKLLRSSRDSGIDVGSESDCKVVNKGTNKEENKIDVSKWHVPTKEIIKPMLQALSEFEMINNGDRVLVCLSGGKDSLSLLHSLRHYQFYSRARNLHFELGAITVDPGSTAYDPRPLIPYLKSLNVPYFYEEQGILQQASNLPECSSICSFCSRMKRGRLYASARKNGYNVLALGQHLDDLAESFFMSVFHNGRLRTMKAHYTIQNGDLRIIRPLVYVREKSLRTFAETKKLPVIPENCPACFEVPKERHRTKQLLAQQEVLYPRLFGSLRSALHPLLRIRQTGIEGPMFSNNKKIKKKSFSQSPRDSDSENE